jgi:ankyrin repeat protein
MPTKRITQTMIEEMLIQAIDTGDIEFIKKYIKEGGNINFHLMSHYNDTPLIYAITKNRFNIVKLLMENSADMFLTDISGNNAISVAYYYYNKFKTGKKILDYLFSKCKKKICSFRIESGVYGHHLDGKTVISNDDNTDFLEYTVDNKTIKPIIKEPKLSKRTKTMKKFRKPTNTEMFLDYVASGREDLVDDYLDNGGDPKVVNCKGESALHLAVAHHRNKILERILPYFTEDELDQRDQYGLPAHMVAIKYGNEYGAKLLSEYHKLIKTKPYKFKNYSFENNSYKNDNLIINGDKITSNINQKSLEDLINKMSKLNKLNKLNDTKKSTKLKRDKTVKKQNIPANNENINTKIRRIFAEMFNKPSKTKRQTSKKKSEKNLLNEIEQIQRIENLPEGLQYLPKRIN